MHIAQHFPKRLLLYSNVVLLKLPNPVGFIVYSSMVRAIRQVSQRLIFLTCLPHLMGLLVFKNLDFTLVMNAAQK